MIHTSIDQYASRSSFYYLDPRAKILAFTFFIIIVSFLKELFTLLIAIFYINLLIFISWIPPLHIMKRYSIAVPFILFASLTIYFTSGILLSISMFIRISTCVLALILLTSIILFFDTLKALRTFKLPEIFLSLLLFTYRYFFVILDELNRMTLARKSRGQRKGKHIFDRKGMQPISFTAGLVLVRAYERGNRMFTALLSRGYDGKIKTLTQLHFKPSDYIFCVCLSSFSILLFCIDWKIVL
jgi:cobalt/nickel transport system permease protein